MSARKRQATKQDQRHVCQNAYAAQAMIEAALRQLKQIADVTFTDRPEIMDGDAAVNKLAERTRKKLEDAHALAVKLNHTTIQYCALGEE